MECKKVTIILEEKPRGKIEVKVVTDPPGKTAEMSENLGAFMLKVAKHLLSLLLWDE